jgi:hypothetical protein
MVVIDLDIAFGRNVQVEKPMHGEEGEHMVKKGHTRIDRCLTVSVNRQDQPDVRLPCLPFDNTRSHFIRFHNSLSKELLTDFLSPVFPAAVMSTAAR